MHIVKAGLDAASVLSAFDIIVAELGHRPAEESAVPVVVSFGASSVVPFVSARPYPRPWERIYDALKEITDRGAYVVVSAGNQATTRSRTTDTLPALFRLASPAIPLLVAGAVDNEGALASFSQQFPFGSTIYAPGVSIRCAGVDRPSGTSYSTGMVIISWQ